MELFKNTNFDFLGKKWPFIIASLVLTAAGFVSLGIKGGPEYGIDFSGGTLMYVKFTGAPPVQKIRQALAQKISGEISVVEVTGQNEVLISTELREARELDRTRRLMVETLASAFGQPGGEKIDINNSNEGELFERMRDTLQKNGVAMNEEQVRSLTRAILYYKNTPPRSGAVSSLDQFAQVQGVTPQVLSALKQTAYASSYSIRGVDVVGPKVGRELQQQAILATLYALGGMLVYIAFRFEWIYGMAAVIAVFHDVLITIGLFSILNKPIDLTVVAALLTLVGYSMNDTIVVFDRIRENLKLMRREPLPSLVNKSINQTLSRTILTSGLTFLTAVSLYLFGGQVLHGFSFALVVGIIVGTYSSVFIASPILIFWHNLVDSRKAKSVVTPAKEVRGGTVRTVK
jgi:preprotein translocase SecF subunit